MLLFFLAITKDINGVSYSEMDGAYRIDGPSINERDMPDFKFEDSINGYPVTEVADSAFYFNERLSGHIILPSNLNSIGEFAFSGCRFIQIIEIRLNGENAAINRYAFASCTSLSIIILTSTDPFILRDYCFASSSLQGIGYYGYANPTCDSYVFPESTIIFSDTVSSFCSVQTEPLFEESESESSSGYDSSYGYNEDTSTTTGYDPNAYDDSALIISLSVVIPVVIVVVIIIIIVYVRHKNTKNAENEPNDIIPPQTYIPSQEFKINQISQNSSSYSDSSEGIDDPTKLG